MNPGYADKRVAAMCRAVDFSDPVERLELRRIFEAEGYSFGLSIDPGCSSSGCAVWMDGILIRAWNVYDGGSNVTTMVAKMRAATDAYPLTRAWIEVPQTVYKKKGSSRGRVKPESIIKLAWCAGRMGGALEARGVELVEVTPSAWKKSLPKPPNTKVGYVVEHRVNKVLSNVEKTRIEWPMKRNAPLERSIKRTYEVTDALGVGLYGLQRVYGGLHPNPKGPYQLPEHHT